ncbi:hypothetical protein HET69_38985 [Streptomyces sp. CJ_13]|uniref:hypothetical protein n=1 Tax=Streptomyces sp. CJ_13 TaxID=2724943 RepID=UPI001BDD70E0|nr:hypothetical protein [Streptomyces sp. CJ_13]MBT1189809.1 hypothetical protein [Streptomyces sp. CJ_13]
MSVFSDIAAICHPTPARGDEPDEAFDDICHAVHADREKMIRNLEAAADADWQDNEPLLSAIGMARHRKAQAEAEIRRLIAYGREFTRPRPYKLADLAAASGMSVSGTRTAYGHDEVADVEQALSRAAREWRATSADDSSSTDSAS